MTLHVTWLAIVSLGAILDPIFDRDFDEFYSILLYVCVALASNACELDLEVIIRPTIHFQ